MELVSVAESVVAPVALDGEEVNMAFEWAQVLVVGKLVAEQAMDVSEVGDL